MTARLQNELALLTAEYAPVQGGIGDYTRLLASALRAEHIPAQVWTGHQGAGDGVPRVVLELPVWNWQVWGRMLAAVHERKPAIVHIQYQTGAYGMHPAINLLPAVLRRLPEPPAIVVTAHDLLPPYLFPKAGPVRHAVTGRLLKDADAVVTTNDDDYAKLSAGQFGRIRRLVQIPIGTNIQPVAVPERGILRARLGLPEGPIVAFFGLISQSKGLETLLDAAIRLPDVHLLIIGGDSPAAFDRDYAGHIRQRLREPALAGRVTATGHLGDSDASAYLSVADVIALPFADGASYRRGSVLAALAHGTPLVTTHPSSPMSPPLRDGYEALLVPPGDAPALASALSRALHTAPLRATLRRESLALAAQFGWPAIARQHIDLYRELLRP